MFHRTLMTCCCCAVWLTTLSACGENGNAQVTTHTLAPADIETASLKTLEGEPSIPANARTDPLKSPAGLEASQEAEGIRLRWLPSIDSAVSYRVYWSEYPDVTQASPYTDMYEATYLHQGVIAGNTYHFSVSSWRENIESPLSTMLVTPAGAEHSVGSDAAE